MAKHNANTRFTISESTLSRKRARRRIFEERRRQRQRRLWKLWLREVSLFSIICSCEAVTTLGVNVRAAKVSFFFEKHESSGHDRLRRRQANDTWTTTWRSPQR
ncbi:hypothetical protein PanWU01x14_224310 [Parasponia andersonii]|uniref:Transmembrane protein n=1 Tax=Parasponia andersonii TaxID=3476 RepID=A0A2P5BN66_PARAD|nr:hypothetical protein PanWU01x14_224310 [Parasponia andersonii]